ncbi:MAG: hypothetical protein ACR2GR_06810, partial [Rhodothermales bacterium]
TDAEAQTVREHMGELKKTLVTSEKGSYPQPMLIDQLEYLYGMTTRADQQLGQDAFNRFEELRGQLDDFLQQLNRASKTTDVASDD